METYYQYLPRKWFHMKEPRSTLIINRLYIPTLYLKEATMKYSLFSRKKNKFRKKNKLLLVPDNTYLLFLLKV